MAFSYYNPTLKRKLHSGLLSLPLCWQLWLWCDWKAFQINSRMLVFWGVGSWACCAKSEDYSQLASHLSGQNSGKASTEEPKICRPPQHPRLLCVNSNGQRNYEIDMLAWALCQNPRGHYRQEWFGLLTQFELDFWKKIGLLYFICMSIFPVCMSVDHMPGWCIRRRHQIPWKVVFYEKAVCS